MQFQNQNFGRPQPQGNFGQPMMNSGWNAGNPMFAQDRTGGYQSSSQNQMYGRFINNPSEVRPNEVPMDGSCSFFPMMDGSAIYVMCWSQDGSRIVTTRFVSDSNQNGDAPKTPEQLIMERLDNLEALIKNQSKPYFKKGGNRNERNDAGNAEPNDRQQSERSEQPKK